MVSFAPAAGQSNSRAWPPGTPAALADQIAATGAKLWSFPTGATIGESSPAVTNGVVYIASFQNAQSQAPGRTYALNAATGAKLWSFKTGQADASSPAVANGVVYIGSGDGNVYALNAATGAKLWSFKTGNAVYSSPAVANGVVYIFSGDGNVYGFNAATGAKLWSFKTGQKTSQVQSSPAVANGMVYVGSGSAVDAFHLRAGPRPDGGPSGSFTRTTRARARSKRART